MAVLEQNPFQDLYDYSTSAGNQMMALKKNDVIVEALEVSTADNPTLAIYKKPRIPTPGIIYNEIDMEAAQGKMDI